VIDIVEAQDPDGFAHVVSHNGVSGVAVVVETI
jgi:hypothetical protein